MDILKAGKQIVGAKFTAAEKKALSIEVRRMIGEKTDEWGLEVAAMVLWQLHEEFGFGYDRLKRYFTGFDDGVLGLTKRYMLEENDDAWLCTRKLKDELGIDILEWRKELRNESNS